VRRRVVGARAPAASPPQAEKTSARTAVARSPDATRWLNAGPGSTSRSRPLGTRARRAAIASATRSRCAGLESRPLVGIVRKPASTRIRGIVAPAQHAAAAFRTPGLVPASAFSSRWTGLGERPLSRGNWFCARSRDQVEPRRAVPAAGASATRRAVSRAPRAYAPRRRWRRARGSTSPRDGAAPFRGRFEWIETKSSARCGSRPGASSSAPGGPRRA